MNHSERRGFHDQNAHPSYSIIMRVELLTRPGMLGKVTSAIGKAGGNIGAVDIVGFTKETTIRDITVNVAGIPMGQKVVDQVRRIKGINVPNVTDRTNTFYYE
jgi:malate dehydrogenase (oxaloacetate-decarboxylating)